MSNDVTAIQNRWEKIYQKIRPTKTNNPNFRAVDIFLTSPVKGDINVIESIHSYIMGLSTISEAKFGEISKQLAKIEDYANNQSNTLAFPIIGFEEKTKKLNSELKALLKLLKDDSKTALSTQSEELNKTLQNINDKFIRQLLTEEVGGFKSFNQKMINEQNQKYETLGQKVNENIERLDTLLSNQSQKLNDISQNINNERIQQLNDELEKLKNIAKNQINEQNKNFDTLSQTLQENINRIDIEMKNIHFVYDEQYKKLSNSLIAYNMFFVVSLVVFFSVSVYLFNDILPQPKTLEKNSDIILPNLSFIITTLLIKLPFLLPFIWLSIFLSNRRAEIHRLQQEYLHKSTFAQSYLKYEEQIKNLPEDKQGGLLATLLDKLIETVSFNPSTTLDKKSKDTSFEDMYHHLDKERTYISKIKDFFTKDSENKDE